MLTVAEAYTLISQHLGETSRARHSRFVGYIMRRLAEMTHSDTIEWEVTGLCHDLDFAATAADRSQHGLLAAEWLTGELPGSALEAIRAHDYRTGITSDTQIARALKLADTLAIAADDLSSETATILSAQNAVEQLRVRFADRPYLASLLVSNALTLGIPLAAVAAIVTSGPPSS